MPADPWGNALCLSLRPDKQATYDILSYGADGTEGGTGAAQTSRAGSADGAGATDGFTLLEVVCVVAIVAMLAAIVLPALPRGTSRARLEAYAIEAAALLKVDRNAAIRNRVQIATEIDAPARVDALGRDRPRRSACRTTCASMRCWRRAAISARPAPTIRFFASGMSCGGAIALTRLGVGYRDSRQLADRRCRGCSDRTSSRAPQGTEGFTLIEVLVALAVVAISLVGDRLADRRDDRAARARSAGISRWSRPRARS